MTDNELSNLFSEMRRATSDHVRECSVGGNLEEKRSKFISDLTSIWLTACKKAIETTDSRDEIDLLIDSVLG